MYLCATDKRGVSAFQLSKLIIKVCYKSAWYLLGQSRIAMGQRAVHHVLFSLVEMDGCYFGGFHSSGRRGHGAGKVRVVAALSKTAQGISLFAHMETEKNLKTETLQKFVNQHLAEGSVVQYDEYSSCCGLTGVSCNRKAFDLASGDNLEVLGALSMAVVPNFNLISMSLVSVLTVGKLSTSFFRLAHATVLSCVLLA